MRQQRTLVSLTTVAVLCGALVMTVPTESMAEFRIIDYGGYPSDPARYTAGVTANMPGQARATSANAAMAPASAGPGVVAPPLGTPAAAHFAQDGKYNNPIIQGFGKNLPLPVVFNQVLPTGWQVYYASDEIRDKRASWTGNRPLTDILDTLVATANIDIEADLDRRRLYVSKAIAHTGTLAVVGRHGTGVAIADTGLAFHMEPGEMLSQAIDRWAAKAGYDTAWQLNVDYPIEYPVKMRGTIYEAIDLLAHSYRRQGVMKNVEFVFKKANRVLVVREYDHEIAATGE